MDQIEQNCKISKIPYSEDNHRTPNAGQFSSHWSYKYSSPWLICQSRSHHQHEGPRHRRYPYPRILLRGQKTSRKWRSSPKTETAKRFSRNKSFVGKWILLKNNFRGCWNHYPLHGWELWSGWQDSGNPLIGQYVWVFIGVSRNVETASRPLARTWCQRRIFPRPRSAPPSTGPASARPALTRSPR